MFDTQIMIENLGEYTTTNNESQADTVVINSCTVTNGADTGVRQYVSKLKKDYPEIKIMFTGCGVDTEGKKLFEAGKLDFVFGHSEKTKISEFLSAPKAFISGDKEHIDTSVITGFEGKTKAFIKIQEGCDFSCSYCIIPSVRGHSRSIPARVVIRQIEKLYENGFEEFVFTGTNVGSYRDGEIDLAKLLLSIQKLGIAKRLRMGSVEPSQITEEFLEIVSGDIFAKQLHIAIQHSSNRILKAMSRQNRYEDDLALFEKLSSLGFAIGTDYIVGFPGESDENWEEALKNIEAMPLTHIHPFIYSKRDHTEAATLKADVNGVTAKERLHTLNEIVKQKNYLFRKNLQSPLIIHVEDSGKSGFDQYFNKVTFETKTDKKWVVTTEYEVLAEQTLLRGEP